MSDLRKTYPLDVEPPMSWTHVVREVPTVTVEQREEALEKTMWNEFAFPAGMLYVDTLSDSGTTNVSPHAPLNRIAISRASSRCCFWSAPIGTRSAP